MGTMKLTQIGKIVCDEEGFSIQLAPAYAKALTGLTGFSHIEALWWFDGCDDSASRARLTEAKPYVHGPDTLGVFATRSPCRPNPIALSCVGVTYLDAENGVIGLDYIDANDESPVLDIKPYTPSLDRAEQASVPEWCAHWPTCREASGDFDWDSEFNF